MVSGQWSVVGGAVVVTRIKGGPTTWDYNQPPLTTDY